MHRESLSSLNNRVRRRVSVFIFVRRRIDIDIVIDIV